MENEIRYFTIQDIYDEHDKQQKADSTKVYDPLHFWDDYGDKYLKGFKKPQEIARNAPWVIHTLKMLGCKSLLDVGCGFCRLDPLLLDAGVVENITAIDISSKQLGSAHEYLGDYEKKDKITIQKASVKNLPFKDGEFDCVLSSECLQHLHLPSVRYALHHILRVASKYAIIIERFIYDGEHPKPHIWSHNYSKLLYDMGAKVIENQIVGNGIIGIVVKK